MATWNATISDPNTLLFTDVAWLGHLCSALNQRGIKTSGGGTWSISTGDDVQDHAWWAGIQQAVSNAVNLRTAGVVIGWVRNDGPVNATGGANYWTESSLRTYLDLVVATQRDGADPGAPYWRRKKPREAVYSSTSYTLDNDGNTLSAGMVAWVSGFTADTCKMIFQGATNEVQTIVISGSPTGGTFTLSNGSGTATLAYNAIASDIQAAMEGLTGGPGNVTVSGSGPFTVTYVGSLANTRQPMPSVGSNLTGGTNPSVNVQETTFGGPWIPAPYTDSPDVLDSNNAHMDNDFVLPGLMQAGDYITPCNVAELRAILNTMVWLADAPSIVAGSGGSGESDAIPGTLTAAAQTAAQIQADSRYTVMVGGSAFPGTFSAIKGFPDNSSASKCAVYLSSGDIPYVSTLDAAIACSVDYYLWPEGTLPLSDLETFDAEGVSFLAVNQWCFWETKGPATGTITSDAWTTTLPPDWPQGPVVTTPYTTQVGYSIPGDVGGVYSVGESGRGPGVLTIVKYDVTGGFAEQASSP